MLITCRAQYISIFKPQVGGEWAEEEQGGEMARNAGLMTESEDMLHSFWQMKSSYLDGVEIPVKWGVPISLLYWFEEKLEHLLWHHATKTDYSVFVTDVAWVKALRKRAFWSFDCIIFASVTLPIFDSPDSTKYCSTVSLLPSCIKK